MFNKYIISTNTQKILKFLLAMANEFCYEREVARDTGISYGSANNILNKLYNDGFLERQIKGKMKYYNIKLQNPYIHELKILVNILSLEQLIEELKPHSQKVVLFGSYALGEDTKESDIDLFIVSSNEKDIRAIINKYNLSKKKISKTIQAIIVSPLDLLSKKEDKVFMQEVNKGKILWQRGINEDYL